MNVSVKEAINIGTQLRNGTIHVRNVVDHLGDDGSFNVDLHRERVIKLLDTATILDARNDAIRKKLKTKGLSTQKRKKLKEDFDKNVLNILMICRKVCFGKAQFDRMVALLRIYLNEVEQAENKVRKCCEATGLFPAKLEGAETMADRPAGTIQQVITNTSAGFEKLRPRTQTIMEASRQLGRLAQETGFSRDRIQKGHG